MLKNIKLWNLAFVIGSAVSCASDATQETLRLVFQKVNGMGVQDLGRVLNSYSTNYLQIPTGAAPQGGQLVVDVQDLSAGRRLCDFQGTQLTIADAQTQQRVAQVQRIASLDLLPNGQYVLRVQKWNGSDWVDSNIGEGEPEKLLKGSNFCVFSTIAVGAVFVNQIFNRNRQARTGATSMNDVVRIAGINVNAKELSDDNVRSVAQALQNGTFIRAGGKWAVDNNTIDYLKRLF
ncbi:MAG: hypothetical protein LBF66_00920 [Holosporales bacterium]|jgi:hypothetical protein|nr:hypothetical protein [Holosporales bacterium]